MVTSSWTGCGSASLTCLPPISSSSPSLRGTMRQAKKALRRSQRSTERSTSREAHNMLYLLTSIHPDNFTIRGSSEPFQLLQTLFYVDLIPNTPWQDQASMIHHNVRKGVAIRLPRRLLQRTVCTHHWRDHSIHHPQRFDLHPAACLPEAAKEQ